MAYILARGEYDKRKDEVEGRHVFRDMHPADALRPRRRTASA